MLLAPSIAAAWDTPLYLQYGDGMQPYARVVLPPLHTRQRYDISLRLNVPASESNFVLGNFMTTLTLLDSGNYTLASARRPAIVTPPTTSFFRRKSNSISIHVPLLSSFLPGTSYVEAEVSVGRGDGWTGVGNGQPRELSVSSASLKGLVVHHGVRGILTRFPFLSSIAASGIFLSILTIIVGVCVLPSALQGLPELEESPPTKDITYEDSESETELKLLRRRSKSKSRTAPGRSSSQRRRSSRDIKTESEPVDIPSAEEADIPLRRRTSRLSRSVPSAEDSP
ncbi:hypothetical protein PQX77_008223 [Marasmius sp. AFHP31]|nr:hypothetical protein PQX77_008282 [Marasmius sp. AFHP31]KAK1228729.1 hypothetical protein PQX77_008223 [Marasmius sp. AFHP31]